MNFMKFSFKKASALVAIALGVTVASTTPALASNNPKAICGYKTGQDYVQMVGIFYVVDNDGNSYLDQYAEKKTCETANGKIADMVKGINKAAPGTTNGWYEQKFESTWSDRGNDSDALAIQFGVRGSVGLWKPAYRDDIVNVVDPNTYSMPHNLLSCMKTGHTYKVTFMNAAAAANNNAPAGGGVMFEELTPGAPPVRDGFLPNRFLNCVNPF